VTPSDPTVAQSRIEQGVLHLDGAGDFTVEVKELKAIKLVGAGNVEVKDLKGKKLEVSIAGAGNVIPAGTVEEVDVHVSGAGDFKGVQLKGKVATVTMSGTGTAIVNATERLTADISGAGNIEYIGKPQIDQSVTGVGEVRQHTPKEKKDQ